MAAFVAGRDQVHQAIAVGIPMRRIRPICIFLGIAQPIVIEIEAGVARIEMIQAESPFPVIRQAVTIGVSTDIECGQTIVAIEKAKYSPTLELAFKIADVFHTRVDNVFTPGPLEEYE